MCREKHGYSWSKSDEKLLEDMLYEGKSYDEMAKRLGRSWYACKCRLIRLKLIPYQYQPITSFSNVEKYDTPIRYVNCEKKQQSEVVFEFTPFEDTSRTFTNDEIDVVIKYFKSRLARLAIQKLDTKCFQKSIDISVAEDIFKNEISKLRNIKTLSIEDREDLLTKLA